VTDVRAMRAERARRWLTFGLSCLVSALGLSLGTDGWFSPLLAVFGAVVACVGLHRLGRSGARAWPEAAQPEEAQPEESAESG